jgi:hypothetical protein
VAQSFGGGGQRVEKFDDIANATKGQPGLTNMATSRQPVTSATKGMVGQTDDKNMIVVPHHDNVPRLIIRRNKRRRMALTEQVFHMAEARRHAVKINTTNSAMYHLHCVDICKVSRYDSEGYRLPIPLSDWSSIDFLSPMVWF